MLNCVLEAESAARAVSVATCTRVCMRGVVLIVVSAFCSRVVHPFRTRTWLVEWVGRAGGLLVVLL